MNINENTIIRVKVPKELYESVKAQLTLKEAKDTYGVPEGTVIKEKSASGGDKPKKTSAKKPAAPKKAKAEAPEKEGKAPHDGMKKAKAPEKKQRTLDELKKIHEMLGERIAEMEGGDKEKVEESIEPVNEEEYDYRRDRRSTGEPEPTTQERMDDVWRQIDQIDAEVDQLKGQMETDDVAAEKIQSLERRRQGLVNRAFQLRDMMAKAARMSRRPRRW